MPFEKKQETFFMVYYHSMKASAWVKKVIIESFILLTKICRIKKARKKNQNQTFLPSIECNKKSQKFQLISYLLTDDTLNFFIIIVWATRCNERKK